MLFLDSANKTKLYTGSNNQINEKKHKIPEPTNTEEVLQSNSIHYYVPLIYDLVVMDRFLLREVKCLKINKVVFASITLYFSCIPKKDTLEVSTLYNDNVVNS